MTSGSTDARLDEYLQRVGFEGEAQPDIDTLSRLHRAHLAAIAYENLDVQFERPIGIDLEPTFDKIVRSRRGGWCYEMNGLFAWALEQIGFRVTRVAGAVLRERLGDRVIGNHLALIVELDQLYLADVGFGDGVIEPAAIREGSFRQDFMEFRFERVQDWWRFHNQPHGGAASFDFQLTPAATDMFERQSQWLQTSPESGFVQNAVCQRYDRGELSILRGKVFKSVTASGVTQQTVATFDDYRDVLDERFDIALATRDVELLWAKVSERHAVWLANQ